MPSNERPNAFFFHTQWFFEAGTPTHELAYVTERLALLQNKHGLHGEPVAVNLHRSLSVLTTAIAQSRVQVEQLAVAQLPQTPIPD